MVGLPEDGDGHLDASGDGARCSRRSAARTRSCSGPGSRRTRTRRRWRAAIVPRIDVPLVIDADGLNALAGHIDEILPQRRWPTVLTPHAGELGRLLEVDSEEVERSRLRHAREAAARSHAFVVLKGDDTLVAAPSGRVAISRGRAPGAGHRRHGRRALGRDRRDAGQGDAGRRRRACAGVYAHVRAGQIAAAPHGPDGVIASDVIAALPAALSA